jgi:hypothetical protein
MVEETAIGFVDGVEGEAQVTRCDLGVFIAVPNGSERWFLVNADVEELILLLQTAMNREGK